MAGTLVVSIICQINFGKGLKKYCMFSHLDDPNEQWFRKKIRKNQLAMWSMIWTPIPVIEVLRCPEKGEYYWIKFYLTGCIYWVTGCMLWILGGYVGFGYQFMT